jgi:hypothetical protein
MIVCDSRGKRKKEEKNRGQKWGGLTSEREITFVPGQETTRYKLSYLYQVRYLVKCDFTFVPDSFYRLDTRYK